MKKIVILLSVFLISCYISKAQWQQLNGPSGGSINLIEVNNDLIFALSESNRLYYSTNNGEQWIETYSKNLWGDIHELDFVGNKIYTCTSYGLWVSTDTAESWALVSMDLYPKSIQCVKITGDNMFAGTLGEGLFQSTNNGQNWFETDSSLSDKYIFCLAVKNNNIFAGTNSGIYLSSDMGESWHKVNNGLTYVIINNIVIKDENIYAGTNGGGIFMSSNMGQSWTSISGDLPNKFIKNIALTDNEIYIATGNGVFLSTNNGESWTDIRNSLTSKIINCLAVKDNNLLVGTRFDGIYKSTDKGQNWVLKGLTEIDVFELAIEEGNLYLGTYKGGIYLSTDDGISWTTLNSGLPPNPSVQTLAIKGNTIFAGMYMSGGVFVSTNLGESWSIANSGLTNTWINDFAINGNDVYAGTNGGMFLSTNNGDNWTFVDSIFNNIRIITFAMNGNKIYAATEKGLFLSSDSGNSWSMLNPKMIDSLTIYSLAFSENKIYAGTLYKGVFISTDNGTSWYDINSNLNILSIVTNIVTFGKNIIIVFDGYADNAWICPGVFLSTDSAESWKEINSGLTNTCFGNLVVKGEFIYASTGIGVFKAKLSDFGISNVEDKALSVNDDFNIYPNPADEFISVNFQWIAQKADYVRLFNSYGNVVYLNKNIEGDNLKIITSEMPSGMYILQIRSGGEVVNRKVMVVH